MQIIVGARRKQMFVGRLAPVKVRNKAVGVHDMFWHVGALDRVHNENSIKNTQWRQFIRIF